MKPIDVITVAFSGVGLILLIGVYVEMRRGLLKPQHWPWVLGLGGALFTFGVSTAGSLATFPLPEVVRAIPENLLWATLVGIAGFWSGRILQRRSRGR